MTGSAPMGGRLSDDVEGPPCPHCDRNNGLFTYRCEGATYDWRCARCEGKSHTPEGYDD